MLGIYKITNIINNKSYIGKSSDIEKRWKYHLENFNCAREYNKTLYKALRKYGESKFTFEVIEELSPMDYDNYSNQREQYWIKYYDTFRNGYNETSGEDGGYSESAKRKIQKITDDEVKQIRQLYAECTLCLSDAYQLYADKISKRGFQAIWLGENHKKIMPEVFTEENKKKHSLIEHQRQGSLRKKRNQ